MSESLTTTKLTLPADYLPILPETHPFEPIVQCGVLYLGTAPPSAGLHGLDSIQEPFSHRYPVDGTNTVRGIDAVLSICDNGLQLAFTRQAHTVIFFPISSLIYCASVRFSIIANDQSKPSSMVNWRFMPLDTLPTYEDKHPPLFCVVIHRTQILEGNECHCFITKSNDTAIALVRTIAQIYGNLRPGMKCLRSPIFYQLDRFGRKLSEITGIIYISPANDDDCQLNRTNPHRLTDETIVRNYLFDPAYDGFFYRTDASIIEQWQLWDDDGFIGSRPRPPASPFGLHEGLYHDDTTVEIQRYLRQMEDEEPSCSCSSSPPSSSSSGSSQQSSTSTSTCSLSTEYSRKPTGSRSNKQKSPVDSDEFNRSFSNLQTSSFEPVGPSKNIESKKKPIIIEKLVPKPFLSIPVLNPILPSSPTLDRPDPITKPTISDLSSSDFPSFSYQINEHGEKITKEGNRIVFMDVVQMNTNPTSIDSQSYKPRKSRLRASKRVPILDIQSLERLFEEKNGTNFRRTTVTTHPKSKDQPDHSTASDQTDTINLYLKDYYANSTKYKNQSEPSEMKKQRRTGSITSSTHSLKNTTHRRSHSTLTVGPSLNYVERPLIPPSTKPTATVPPVITDEKLNEYITNIYGTARSIKSSSSSTTHQNIQPGKITAVMNPTYISPFRYMQSSMNGNLFQEYRNAY